MSTQKNYVRPLMRTITRDATSSRLRIRLPRYLRWLARPREENSHPAVAAVIALGNERFAKEGYYRVSGEQAMEEKTIDIETMNLLLTRIR